MGDVISDFRIRPPHGEQSRNRPKIRRNINCSHASQIQNRYRIPYRLASGRLLAIVSPRCRSRIYYRLRHSVSHFATNPCAPPEMAHQGPTDVRGELAKSNPYPEIAPIRQYLLYRMRFFFADIRSSSITTPLRSRFAGNGHGV